MSLLPTSKNGWHRYFQMAGKITALLFVIVIGLFSLKSLNASELMQEQHTGENPDDQFLYTGDVFDATFLQPAIAHKKWSIRQWSDEFSRLRQLGTRSLIIQWSQYDEVVFYSELDERDSLLHRVITAATESGLDFYIGLASNSDWSKPQDLNGMKIDAALEENKRIATVIYQKFGQHPGFLGWYIPQELTDIFYTDDQHNLIIAFFSSLTRMLHELDRIKPVLASGYTSPEKSHLVKFTMWWMRVFDESGIDILIFQDGVGITDQKKWKAIKPYAEAISIIDDEYASSDIWFVVEIFTQVDGSHINNKPFRAKPANFDRVSQQLEMLGRFGKKIVSYAYFPYMRPASSKAASRLYDRYREYVEQRAAINRVAIAGNYDAQQSDIATGDYFELGEQHKILGTPQPWEASSPHTLSVVERNAGGYRYWGYYGLQDGNGGVGLARSNDLLNWEKYAGNPLFENGRWPSVIRLGDRELMMVTRDYATTSHIMLFSSRDGLQFSAVSDIILPVEDERNQNPNLYFDRNSEQYYLYWYSGGVHSGISRIRVRVANSPEGLADPASEQLVFEKPYVLAAPNMFQNGRNYYLATEILQDVWKTRVYKGGSPLGPFKLLEDNPILDNGAACLFQHGFGDRLHVYYCKLSSGVWSMAYRGAALSGF